MSIATFGVLKLFAVACLTLGGVIATAAVATSRETPLHRLYFRYVSSLERRMRLMFIDVRGAHVFALQGSSIVVLLGLAIVLRAPMLLGAMGAVAVAPHLILERKRRQRTRLIEEKLEGFVLALANALRASPSPGRALAMIHPVTPAPLDRELELVLREMRVGSTLEQALGNLSARVRSFQVDAALSCLLIGRQTGGDVPLILDGAAQTLREMTRLHGVLRAKTAEGRAQANVLAVFPLVLIFAFDYVSPGYFRPLTESATGFVVMAMAVGMWISSVIMTRRIMAVEL